jgi:hypothetical protein
MNLEFKEAVVVKLEAVLQKVGCAAKSIANAMQMPCKCHPTKHDAHSSLIRYPYCLGKRIEFHARLIELNLKCEFRY